MPDWPTSSNINLPSQPELDTISPFQLPETDETLFHVLAVYCRLSNSADVPCSSDSSEAAIFYRLDKHLIRS